MKDYPLKEPNEYYSNPEHFSKNEYSHEKYSEDDKELNERYTIPEKKRFTITQIAKIYKKSKHVAKSK